MQFAPFFRYLLLAKIAIVFYMLTISKMLMVYLAKGLRGLVQTGA